MKYLQNMIRSLFATSGLGLALAACGVATVDADSSESVTPVIATQSNYGSSPVCITGYYESAHIESKVEWASTCSPCSEYGTSGGMKGKYFERCYVVSDLTGHIVWVGDWKFIKYRCGACNLVPSGPLE